MLTFICEAFGLDPADYPVRATDEAPATPAAPKESQITPDGYGVAYAYNPGQGAWSNGRNHLIVVADLDVGRLHRKAGDPLCRPARKFWGLQAREPEAFDQNPCKRCAEARTSLKTSAA